MSCKGLHCGGCKSGAPVPVGLIVLVVIIIAAVAKAVAAAVGEAFHVLAVVLEVVLITIASAAGIGVLAGLTWAGIRIHRRYAIRAAAADHRALGQPVRIIAEVVQPGPQAIEAPKPRLDGLPEIREEGDDRWPPLTTGTTSGTTRTRTGIRIASRPERKTDRLAARRPVAVRTNR